MERLNKDARRYLREIRGWLPCTGRMKRNVMNEIRGTVQDFLDEDPNADYAAITARFGTPEQIAGTYVDEAETGKLLHDLRIRRKIVKIAIVAAASLLFIWLGAVGIMICYNAHQASTGVIFVDIVEDTWLAEDGGNP